MNFSLVKRKSNLAQIARDAFTDALREVDAARAVQTAIQIDEEKLSIGENQFDLREIRGIYSVALGKAAAKMAGALTISLGERLTAGVVSGTDFKEELSPVWQTFTGGHPIPNEQSLTSGEAALRLLKDADRDDSLVIFLVSGGGSAMLESPVNPRISLSDLQIVNQVLVGCGATISEINALRQRISAVKGGGLSRAAKSAKQVTLIISDTNENEAFDVASGPTITNENDQGNAELAEIMERYNLRKLLPETVIECLDESILKVPNSKPFNQNWKVLLQNDNALRSVERSLQNAGFAVGIAMDLVETPIESGCRELVKRLIRLRAKTAAETPTAIISGGEFVCPVRGRGTGGRNLESALRTAILFDQLKHRGEFPNTEFAALFGGTDGIDGNSPAAGAVCDETTIERAAKMNLYATEVLNTSDSYNYFAALENAIETGATGTNVRDVRILLAN